MQHSLTKAAEKDELKGFIRHEIEAFPEKNDYTRVAVLRVEVSVRVCEGKHMVDKIF